MGNFKAQALEYWFNGKCMGWECVNRFTAGY